MDDARELHDIEDDKNQIQRKMKRMHANVSRLIISKQVKSAKKEFLGINEELERILERCDGVQLDPKDENNRKHRKKLIKDTQKLLDRNDKGTCPIQYKKYYNINYFMLFIKYHVIGPSKLCLSCRNPNSFCKLSKYLSFQMILLVFQTVIQNVSN